MRQGLLGKEMPEVKAVGRRLSAAVGVVVLVVLERMEPALLAGTGARERHILLVLA
jgi:hypothetical protein